MCVSQGSRHRQMPQLKPFREVSMKPTYESCSQASRFITVARYVRAQKAAAEGGTFRRRRE
jgi:hypothetical protein